MSEETPLFDLTGRVAIVTGGGSGLGREFCDVLAEHGADVVCPDIDMKHAEETCALIRKHGHRALALEVDMASYDQVNAMFAMVMERFGRLDILVNNAGVAPPSVFTGEVALEDWHRVIDVDLHGVFYCLREGLRIMQRQGRGTVINISSRTGLVASDPALLPQAPYVAAKHAVIGLTKQAAAEYGRYGVRVNCIAPGLHLGTGLPQSSGEKPDAEEAKKRLAATIAKTPLGRAARPEELRVLLLYLASDASSFMTGEVIVHDGGRSLC